MSHSNEKDHALCEAYCNTASDEYFAARPHLDTPENRRIFYAGHRKAWLKHALNEAYCPTPPANPPPARDYSINAAATVAVSNEVYLEPCDHKTPRGVKLQLLTAGGVLVYGHYNGDRFYTHWAPCPRRRKEVSDATT